MFKKIIGFMAIALMICVQTASAAVDLTDVTFPLTTVEALVALILVALAGMFVVRKLIKTSNRS